MFKLNNSAAAILNSVAFPGIISWERVWQNLLSDSYKYELFSLFRSDWMEEFARCGVLLISFLLYPCIFFSPQTLWIHLKSTVVFFFFSLLHKVIPSNITLQWDSFLAGCVAIQPRAWQPIANNPWCCCNVWKRGKTKKMVHDQTVPDSFVPVSIVSAGIKTGPF